MKPISNFVFFAAVALALVGAFARGATLTTLFTEQFEDATIDPLLTQNGTPAPVFSNGFVDLQGTNTNGSAQGFFIDATAYTGMDGGAGPQGGGPNTSFIMEAVVGPEGVAGSDGLGTGHSGNDIMFSFLGRYGLRFVSSGSTWSLFSRPAAGASDVNSPIPVANFYPTAGSHVAIVFTDNGATDTLAYYKNGTLRHSVAGDFNRFNAARAGYGLEVNTGASLGRGFNGTYDAISFSTFTGTFDPAQGDRFVLPIPEPSALALGMAGFAAVASQLRRRRHIV